MHRSLAPAPASTDSTTTKHIPDSAATSGAACTLQTVQSQRFFHGQLAAASNNHDCCRTSTANHLWKSELHAATTNLHSTATNVRAAAIPDFEAKTGNGTASSTNQSANGSRIDVPGAAAKPSFARPTTGSTSHTSSHPTAADESCQPDPPSHSSSESAAIHRHIWQLHTSSTFRDHGSCNLKQLELRSASGGSVSAANNDRKLVFRSR